MRRFWVEMKNLRYAVPAVAAMILLLGGCGGGGSDSYTDVAADMYAQDASATTLVEPAVVKAWVDAGMKTESGKRVVILDCVPNPPGAGPFSDTESWFAEGVI